MTTPTTSSRTWAVWVVGLLVYVLAVFHRSSLGVAGLVATERFGISAAQLATFTMLQLLVYSVLARQGRRSVYLVWAAFVVVVCVGYFVTTLHQLITLVVSTDLVLFVVLLGVGLYSLRKDDEQLLQETAGP